MRKFFTPYELAIKLQEKGFDDDCICSYNKSGKLCSKVSYSSGNDCECKWGKDDASDLRAPLYQQIIDWLRIKHDISLEMESGWSWVDGKRITEYVCWVTYDRGNKEDEDANYFNDYYEALIDGIEEALVELI